MNPLDTLQCPVNLSAVLILPNVWKRDENNSAFPSELSLCIWSGLSFSSQCLWSLFLSISRCFRLRILQAGHWGEPLSLVKFCPTSRQQEEMSICSRWAMRIQADEQKDKTSNFWCSSCFKGIDLCGILNLSAQHDFWLNPNKPEAAVNPGQWGLRAFLIYKLGPKYFKRTLDSLPYGRAATFRKKKIYITGGRCWEHESI